MAQKRFVGKLFHLGFLLKRPMTLGVRLLATNQMEEILLVKHTYVPGWYLPGGGVETGETALEAACKELSEETGHAPGKAPTLLGVYFNIGINSYIIDAIIGFSVAYKALDNLGAFRVWFGVQPSTKAATLIFGFLHGFGLASKIIDYDMSPDGLVPNLLAFNLGVEIGQLLALAIRARGEDHQCGCEYLSEATEILEMLCTDCHRMGSQSGRF